jgi:hypothetical protein
VLGEGNVALVVVRNGSVTPHWVRGKDAHYRVSGSMLAVAHDHVVLLSQRVEGG